MDKVHRAARGSPSRSVYNGKKAPSQCTTQFGSETAAARSKAVIVDDGKRKCSAKRAETERLPRPDTPSLRHPDTPTPSALGRAAGRTLSIAMGGRAARQETFDYDLGKMGHAKKS